MKCQLHKLFYIYKIWYKNKFRERHGKSVTDREKARIQPEYPGPGAPISEKPVPIRGPLKGLLGKALKFVFGRGGRGGLSKNFDEKKIFDEKNFDEKMFDEKNLMKKNWWKKFWWKKIDGKNGWKKMDEKKFWWKKILMKKK